MKTPSLALPIFVLNANKAKDPKPLHKDIVSLDRRRTDRKLKTLPYSDLPLIGTNRLPLEYLAA